MARRPRWRRASFCASGECAEVRQGDAGRVELRNSTRPGRVRSVSTRAWGDFAAAISAGEFDDLLVPDNSGVCTQPKESTHA